MSTAPRTIMIIGAGFISRFSHASNLSRLPDGGSCHVCVADPNPAAIEEFKKVIPRAEAFTDYHTMLASVRRIRMTSSLSPPRPFFIAR
ncbi:hypothetical protein QQ056_08695 [Oscillatoria laete-virens NRMC-F 0139]|nr:hypothetical protein [Oscillatoria laete-virens]MDL5053619.1 hypothetical protein [Oscillatoria laete-virens NRMC-F 0139]